ncbi:hypothetical protein [Pseudooceanicola sp.]|uniref:hypothetical protein n=1 Tax=Pseudooceanicola sp. TaxID=1914328 RepID=UPI0035C737D3
MQSTGTSVAATAGTWGTTVKTVAMGAAGTALWGSLAFYFAVGFNSTETVASEEEVKRLFFRMELPEVELVEGCSLNYGEGSCDGQAWIILSEYRTRAETPDMPGALRTSLPEPLWAQVAARNTMADESCRTTLSVDLPNWLAAVPRGDNGTTVTLLPEHLATCQAESASFDPKREYRSFWFLDGNQVVAEMRCSLPGTYMEPSCELAAYPENGSYEVSYSRLPARNVEKIMEQSPHMLSVLDTNLPAENAGIVDLAFLKAPFNLDAETSEAMAELRSVVQ